MNQNITIQILNEFDDIKKDLLIQRYKNEYIYLCFKQPLFQPFFLFLFLSILHLRCTSKILSCFKDLWNH